MSFRNSFGNFIDGVAIPAYPRAMWAELEDNDIAVRHNLDFISALHCKWLELTQTLDTIQWQRTFRHPTFESITLRQAVDVYAWHGWHHLEHIRHAVR